MRTFQKQTRTSLIVCASLLLAGWLISPAQSSDDQEYRPTFQKVIYRRHVPTSILRTARKVGHSRFFGTFQLGPRKFAVHFYDISRVRTKGEDSSRSSRLDIFELTAQKTWHQIQTFPLTRQLAERRDAIIVETQVCYLDPAQKTIPLIYLHVSEGERAGNETAIYGVLLTQPNPKAFLALDGFNPESDITVASSWISFPDAQGHLTIVDYSGDPGSTSELAYSWTGPDWKLVAKAHFNNLGGEALY